MTRASAPHAYVHRGTLIPDPSVPDGVTVLRDIPFGPHPRQSYDLYLPKDRRNPTPIVIFAHGGAWVRRDKRAVRVMHVLDQGFALASVGYRLATNDPFPAQVQDYRRAAAHLVAHASAHGLDPARVFFTGASAGGYLASLAALASRELEFGPTVTVRGVVTIYAPSDLIAMAGPMPHENDSSLPEPSANRLLRVDVRGHPDLARRASPVSYVTPEAPPFLILHGDADRVVPFSQSVILDEHLRRAGVQSDLIRLRGIGHGAPEFREPPTSDAIATFLHRHSA